MFEGLLPCTYGQSPTSTSLRLPSINSMIPFNLLSTESVVCIHTYLALSSLSMALSKPFSIACLLLFMLGFHCVDSRFVYGHHSIVSSERSLVQVASAVTINCGGACAVRCSRSWKPKMCKKMCNACCNKCNCVPPGTSVETRAMCPCYATMTNPRGKLKCP